MVRMVITHHRAFSGWETETKWFKSMESAREWWIENRTGYGRGASIELKDKEPEQEVANP